MFVRNISHALRQAKPAIKCQRGAIARLCTMSDLSKIPDIELFRKSEGLVPKIEAMADALFRQDSERFENITKNKVAPEASFPVRLYLYTKLKHLLLEKYQFNEAEFMEGARGSVNMLLDNIVSVSQIFLERPDSRNHRTAALKNFSQFEKNLTRDLMAMPDVESLSAFVSPRALKQYTEVIIAGILQNMNKYELYGCSLLTIKVHLANEYTDALRLEEYVEKEDGKPPVVLVDATVGLAFRLYNSDPEKKIRDLRNSAMWTFRAPISDEDYDWRIVNMACMVEA